MFTHSTLVTFDFIFTVAASLIIRTILASTLSSYSFTRTTFYSLVLTTVVSAFNWLAFIYRTLVSTYP